MVPKNAEKEEIMLSIFNFSLDSSMSIVDTAILTAKSVLPIMVGILSSVTRNFLNTRGEW